MCAFGDVLWLEQILDYRYWSLKLSMHDLSAKSEQHVFGGGKWDWEKAIRRQHLVVAFQNLTAPHSDQGKPHQFGWEWSTLGQSWGSLNHTAFVSPVEA